MILLPKLRNFFLMISTYIQLPAQEQARREERKAQGWLQGSQARRRDRENLKVPIMGVVGREESSALCNEGGDGAGGREGQPSL